SLVARESAERIIAALAGFGRGGAVDCGAAGRRAGADRGDASLRSAQPTGGNATAKRAYGEPWRRPPPGAWPCPPCLLAVPDRGKQFRHRPRDRRQYDC